MRLKSSIVRHLALIACGVCLATVAFAEERASENVGEHLYGAPSAGAAVVNSSGGSIGQVTLSLALVLAFVFVAAWLLRHFKKLNLTGVAQRLEVVAQVSLGAKERAVLVRVNNVQVLIGVAPGHVTELHTFAANEVVDIKEATVPTASVASGAPTFKSLLKKSLGMP